MPAAARLTGRAIGAWAALAVFILDLMYLLTGIVWLIYEGDPARRYALTPTDPHLAILESLIVLICPCMVVAIAAVHFSAPAKAATYSLAALSFMVLVAGVSCSIHFIDLVVFRRLDPNALKAFSSVVSFPWRWPSVTFGLDLLAWDLFYGLSMIFAGMSFTGGKLERTIGKLMLLSGALCLAGLLGPALGDLRFQAIAIAGYAGLGPFVFLLLFNFLSRSQTDQIGE